MTTSSWNLRFPGQYFDSETGHFQNYFRNYMPSQARYGQNDPIGLDGGMNRFIYAEGDGINGFDPWGLETCLLTTRDISGFGTHSALYISRVKIGPNDKTSIPVIYDPSGSYAPKENLAKGGSADIDKFKKHHKKKDNDETEVTCKNTTEEEEQKLFEKVMEIGPKGGLACSMAVSDVLFGSPYFPGVKAGTFFPGNLAKGAKK
jgi:RHS repeat-associated protein